MLKRLFKNRLLMGVLVGTMAITACNSPLVRNDLEAIKARGELVVITRNNFACYYESGHGHSGFEYELAKAFADHLGVGLRLLVIEEEAEMVETLLRGRADIIAAGQLFGQAAAHLLAMGPGYLEVRKQVVGRRGGPSISQAGDLVQTTMGVTGNSAALERLGALKKTEPALSWQTFPERSSEELLQMVWNRDLPLAVIESNILTMNRRFYPELVVQLELDEPRQLRWAVKPQDRHLLQAVRSWFAKPETHDIIAGLVTHYYSHLEAFDYVDLARYRKRIYDRLPRYQHHFEEAARENGLDWQLVAALAYQESHWDPGAVSFTGVRGIMMITRDTAKTLGLTNRLAIKEGIFAGTLYLSRLHAMVGDDVAEPDRTLFALAAYNVGIGHLQDARALAREMGKAGNTWRGVREVLPLLQQRRYYQTLTHGYARGTETVQYVDRIRTYHKILNMATTLESHNDIGG
jgi:membrane-bound lytic murein transglycosylase F